MANEVLKRHVSRDDLNSPHQLKAPVSAYWQSIMGNRLYGTQECVRFYFSTRYVRLVMTNTSSTLYCICLVTVLNMLKRLKSAIAVFVFEQSDFIFLCVSAIHAWRTICKDYVMNCLCILYKTSLFIGSSFTVLLAVVNSDYTVTVQSLRSHCAYGIGVFLCTQVNAILYWFRWQHKFAPDMGSRTRYNYHWLRLLSVLEYSILWY